MVPRQLSLASIVAIALLLAGCAANDVTRSIVPSGASPVAGGVDINYQITEAGTFYVVDATSGRLLATDRRDNGFLVLGPADLQKLATALSLKPETPQPVVYFLPQKFDATQSGG
jgi:D-alanyl-D-alanine carboxypeptidase